MPVQIEVLLTKTTGKFPLRHYVWIDAKRWDMLCAIAEKYCKLPMSRHDLYVHIPGWIVYRDSGLDLAFIAALASAVHHKTIVPLVWIGEVWLRGYVTKPFSLSKRLLECSGARVIDAQSIKTVGDIYHVR
jgi:DNA repair protein RadA/Sms